MAKLCAYCGREIVGRKNRAGVIVVQAKKIYCRQKCNNNAWRVRTGLPVGRQLKT